jgi:hypothetical protein
MAIMLYSSGAALFVRGGTYTPTRMVWTTRANLAVVTPVYPAIQNFDGQPLLNALIGDQLATLPRVLAYDTFTRGDGALGTSLNLDPEARPITPLSWLENVGTWAVSTNKAVCAAVTGDIGIVTVDAGTPNILAGVAITKGTGKTGLVLRYADSDNYVYAYHDGTNCGLVKHLSGGDADVIAPTATTYSAGKPLQVIADGPTFSLFYNGARVGVISTVSDATLQTGTRVGLFNSVADGSFGAFEVNARGTEGQHEFIWQAGTP